MSEPIKKISQIRNMAVFKEFSWDANVKDKGNNVVTLKQLNILYGWNYSGKTTLSRIVRSLETGEISDKYKSPEFSLLFEDGSTVTQDSLSGNNHIIRVFNEDFIKEHLRFIIDEEGTVNSFAILGEDNAKIEKEIQQIESELGSNEDKNSLRGKMAEANSAYQAAFGTHQHKSNALEDALRDKATNRTTGIKYNTVYNDPNYNITKIKQDIDTVKAGQYSPSTQDEKVQCEKLLTETPKAGIPESVQFELQFTSLVTQTKTLVEKRVQVSESIQELLADSLLNKWVDEGRKYHQGKRTTCAFCGGTLSDELWDKLDKHFNEESKTLGEAIDTLIASVDTEINQSSDLLPINLRQFYSSYQTKAEELNQAFQQASQLYQASLRSLKTQLESRKNDIFTQHVFDEPQSVESNLRSIRDQYEDLRNQSNAFSAGLSEKQKNARTALRLSEIYQFVYDIKYDEQIQDIEQLKTKCDQAEQARTAAQINVTEKEQQIDNLKAQLKDESKGAEEVNKYLNNFLGHHFLSLKAVENNSDGESENTGGYRFEIIRDGEKAYHLSEGECGLIAFCYFIARLDDVETKGKNPIVWIDDPISSLDSNHVFFIFSLINAKIVTPKIPRQLFISTHNLEFLKYLKRLPGASKKDITQYFTINRLGTESIIQVMPNYLKNYVTEFNYLFEQIYQCATIENVDDTNYQVFYNFGNNARKFLEIYLYYKYPSGKEHDKRLLQFFGEDDIPVVFTDRVNNEYSHLAGVFERGSTPVEAPIAEMQTAAKRIIEEIKKDNSQFEALLESIDKSPTTESTEGAAG